MRCWDRAELDLPPGLVLLVGPNGAGKTSLVEAVVLGCLGVSPRTAREAEVVRRGAPALHVSLDLDGPPGRHLREIGFAAGAGPAPAAGRRSRRARSARWRARAVLVFLPDELRAVKGPPAARRRALDRVLEAASPGFAEDLVGYQRALAQRNALLRRVRAGTASEDSLPAWEAQMADPRRRASRPPAAPAWRPSPSPSRAGCPSSAAARTAGSASRPRRRPSRTWTTRAWRRRCCAPSPSAGPARCRRRRRSSGPHRDDLAIAAGAVRPAPRGEPGRAAHGGAGPAPGGPRPPAGPGGAAHPAARRRAERARPAPSPPAARGRARRGPDHRHQRRSRRVRRPGGAP